MKDFLSLPLYTKAIIIIAVMIFPFAMMYFLNPMKAIDEENNRTEQDFITKTFTLQEVRYRTIHQNFDVFYVFLKPKEENINLSFGTDKIFPS